MRATVKANRALAILALLSVALAENPSPVIPEAPAAAHRELARQESSSPGITQPISHPAAGENVLLGSTFTIKWTPTFGSNITIQVWANDGVADIFGETCDNWLVNTECGQIATGIANTGSFDWNVPYFDCWSDASTKDTWHIKTFVLDWYKQGVNEEPVLSYSGDFHIMTKEQSEGGEMKCDLLSTLTLPSIPPSSSSAQNPPSSSPAPVTSSGPTHTPSVSASPPSKPSSSGDSSVTLSSAPASTSGLPRTTITFTASNNSSALSSVAGSPTRTSDTATSSVAMATGAASANEKPWGRSVLLPLLFGFLI